MSKLFEELKRRNVFRVGVAYVVAAWLVLQVLDLVLENIDAPAWIMQMTMIIMALGLPIVLGFAWAFEITPEGVKLERDVDRSKSITPQTGRRLDRLIIVILAAAVGILLVDRFVFEPSTSPNEVVAQPQSGGSRPSIAVLPFVNRSNAADDAFFVDGIHDDILTHLAKISSLKVISRTSVMQYRDTQKPIREIGDELNVATIMEGSVQRAGNRVRINVQLIDAETDEHLWAEIYDRALTASNIFDIQTEMATAIAGELRANLTSEEEKRLAAKPTENLEAYEAYLIGRQRMSSRAVADIADAKAWFLKAINLDPDFALAYVGVADAIQLGVDYGGEKPSVVAREAMPYLDKAIELDPDLGEAYVSLGGLLEYRKDPDAADAAYSRGIELAPNYAQGYMWYGLFQFFTRGQPEKAFEMFERAADVDPMYVVNLQNVAAALRAAGRFDDALNVLARMKEVDPEFPRNSVQFAYHLWAVQGRLDEAIEEYLKALPLDPDDPYMRVELAQLFMDLNDDQTAACWLDRADELAPDGGLMIDERAMFNVLQDNIGAALPLAHASLVDTYGYFYVNFTIAIIKRDFFESGNPSQALQIYEQHFPELFQSANPALNRSNYQAAIDIADVFLALNERSRAEQWLTQIEQFMDGVPRLSEFGLLVNDVRTATLLGDSDRALELLQQAVDAGWRYRWRYFLEFDNVLEPLRSLPEFESIYRQISADMAAQLERVRARETLETSCRSETI
ncbi:MAG: tetratricopeptide repeat protein [Woeseiaceae bacterium]|nr:tetratricopeptide repeat protein [Woeseiaceae bacterium]